MLDSYRLSIANIREVVKFHPGLKEFTMKEDAYREDEYLVTHPEHGSIRIDVEGVDWDRPYLKQGKRVVKGDPIGPSIAKMLGQFRVLSEAMYSVASLSELEKLIKDLGGSKPARTYHESLRWIFSNIGLQEYQDLGFRTGRRGEYGVRPPEFLITKARTQLVHHTKRCRDLGEETTANEWKWLDVGWYPLSELILKTSLHPRKVAELQLSQSGPVEGAHKVLGQIFLTFQTSHNVYCTELIRRVNVLDDDGTWPKESTEW